MSLGMLNPDSPIPLYRQLADLLQTRISEGVYPVGTKIPSEPQLAKFFKIGRPTVRQATEHLVRKKQLVRKRGSGTYVADTSQEVSLFSITGTLKAFKEKMVDIEVELLDPVMSIAQLHEPKHPFDKRAIYRINRRISHNDKPLLVEVIDLLGDVFQGFDRFNPAHESVSALVARHYYLTPKSADQFFSVWMAQSPYDRLLSIDAGMPLLRVRRLVDFDRWGIAVYATLYCRTDQFEFSQTIGG